MLDVRIRKLQGAFELDASFITQGTGITALFGRSGSGKTSIINMVAGLITPDEGRIVVNGKTYFDSARRVNIPTEKRRFGYVFQDGRLFPHLSTKSNLIYGMKLVPLSERYVKFDQVVELLGITHLLNRRPARLSGGEKQRVAIGRALLTSPDLLLMDEPLASLDGARRAELMPFIARLSRELLIPTLYVSHSFDEVLNLADAMVILDSGRVVGSGSLAEITRRYDFETLTGRIETGAVLCMDVKHHDRASALTFLGFPGGLLRVPLLDVQAGAVVRVHIHARDVAIAREKPPRTTILNVFPAKIEQIQESDGSTNIVTLDIGCPIVARITSHARTELGLAPNQEVFALIKKATVSQASLNGKCTIREDSPSGT
ncbi:MAG: molybdenum ABC transporter ATP-binding protein [Desulfomonile tiedjei]|nr:molybdenum ABC transporter ATP-binding protein [Desulfomonile tiedjei]